MDDRPWVAECVGGLVVLLGLELWWREKEEVIARTHMVDRCGCDSGGEGGVTGVTRGTWVERNEGCV